MKKSARITLIVVPLFFIILGASFAGTLWYSAKNVSYQLGNSTITGFISEISFLPPSYEGFIIVDTLLEINNSGLYDILELQISVQIYGQGFLLPLLNGVLFGEGVNDIGDIPQRDSWNGILSLNMTEYIASLAIYNGQMRIEVQISFKLNFLVYKQPLSFNETQLETWTAPF